MPYRVRWPRRRRCCRERPGSPTRARQAGSVASASQANRMGAQARKKRDKRQLSLTERPSSRERWWEAGRTKDRPLSDRACAAQSPPAACTAIRIGFSEQLGPQRTQRARNANVAAEGASRSSHEAVQSQTRQSEKGARGHLGVGFAGKIEVHRVRAEAQQARRL